MLLLHLLLCSRYPLALLHMYHFMSYYYLVYMLMFNLWYYNFIFLRSSLRFHNSNHYFHILIHSHYLPLWTVLMLCFLLRSLFIMCWMRSPLAIRYSMWLNLLHYMFSFPDYHLLSHIMDKIQDYSMYECKFGLLLML